MAMTRNFSELKRSAEMPREVPPAGIGQALDGRHFLDVVEEQQYAGKPFVGSEQEEVLTANLEAAGKAKDANKSES